MSTRRRIALLATLLALTVAAPAEAGSPGKNGKLVYQSGGDLAVSDTNAATDDEVFIVPNATEPSWSADGKRLVMGVPAFGQTKPQIAVANANGSGFKVLTTTKNQESGRASWAPDGTRIVFDRYNAADSLERIVTMKADGGGITPITSPAVGEFHFFPAWSPDGRTIAFAVSIGAETDIQLVDPDGTDRRPFLSTSARESAPAWSPDSTRIAYELDGGISAKPVAGGPAIVITSAGESPEWSPDGVWVLYQAARILPAGPATLGIYASRADGSGDEVLLAAGGIDGSWQPLCNLKGNAKANTLTGTSKPELVCGKGGKDTIDGKGGNDIIFAGAGNDTVKGGPGNDVLVGEQGDDRLDGGTSTDICIQGPGSGTLISC
jgi:hypothetical protein